MRRKWYPVLGWLLGMVLCTVLAARAHYRTDMGDFLPRASTLGQAALNAQINGGGAGHLLLASISGASPEILSRVNATLVAALRGAPEFSVILNGDQTALEQTESFVWQHRYVLNPQVTQDGFSTQGLHAALEKSLALMSSEFGGIIAQALPADPTGTALGLMDILAPHGMQAPHRRDGVWMSPDERASLLLLHTIASGFDLDAQQAAQARLEHGFMDARAHVPGAEMAKLRMTGPGVFAVRARDVTKRDVSRLSFLASAGAILFLLIAYRSVRALVLGALPVVSGVLAGIAVVAFSFGFVHAITIGFGVTLIGEAMDYSIYLLTQLRSEENTHSTIRRIWPTLRLGVLTSLAGFAAMLGSSFIGFAQLGVFSMAGLLVAAGVTRWVIPHLVPEGFCARSAPVFASPVRFLLQHRAWVRSGLGGMLIASVLVLGLHKGDVWQTDLLALSPLPEDVQKLDATLRAELGVREPHQFLVWRAASLEQALVTSEDVQHCLVDLERQGKVGNLTLPSQILPSLRTQQERLAALPDHTTLRTRLHQALAGLPFRPDIFAPFFADIATARTSSLLTPAQLPAPLQMRLHAMLSQVDGGWLVLAPFETQDVQGVEHALPITVGVVDVHRQSDVLLHLFQHEARDLAVYGSLAIVMILAVFMRRWRDIACVVLPLAACVCVCAAFLILAGERLSIFMMAGFVLIIAIGSNYCLFFVRRDSHGFQVTQTLASITLANICTVAAYGLLSLSSIPLLHDIGRTVAVGTFLCLLFGAAFSTPASGSQQARTAFEQ